MLKSNVRERTMGALCVLGVAFSSNVLADMTAEEAVALNTEATATLEQFKADTKGAEEVLDNAKGIVVCPKIVKGGVGVGAEHGKCVLVSGAEEMLYYGSTGLKAGAILGIESHSMILAINTDEKLAKFTGDEREWEFGVDASVAVARVGVGGDLDTTNLKKDIVSFIFGSKGLIGDLTWEGSRFKKLDVITNR
jgi:lipid-binding SYLF domain-containing protein